MEEKLKLAIAYFKDAIKESDEIIAECSEDLKTELLSQKRHFEIAVEAMEDVLATQKLWH